MNPDQRARIEDSLQLADQLSDEWASVMASDLRALLARDAGAALTKDRMVALIAAANDILQQLGPDQILDPVNWGDLSCVSATVGTEYGPDGDAEPVLTILITEAAPGCPALSTAVSQALAARGFPGVAVRTEW